MVELGHSPLETES